LIKNHAFIDGNKRIGLGALVVFLKANGWWLTCSVWEDTGMVLRTAAGDLSEEEWKGWVVANISPL
jgi:death-on-curing protein